MQKKNKAKGKPARNPQPVQKTTATPSVAIPQPPPPVAEGTPIKISEDNRVPEIQATPIHHVPEKEIQTNPQELAPVKPKRHRGGKKRKQNENKTDASEVEINKDSSQPLEARIIIANVDVIQTKPTQSLEFTEKPPVIEKNVETVKIEEKYDVKELIKNKQPIAPKKKKGKNQKNEHQGSDSPKPALDSHAKKDEHDESVPAKEESQTVIDVSEVEKSSPQKKDLDNVEINIQGEKCEPKSKESENVEESRIKEQTNNNSAQKSTNKKDGAKDAMKKPDLSHACEIGKSESPKIEIQKSEPVMDSPKKSESEQQKIEAHKNKKQKTEPQKENENIKSVLESTETQKKENRQSNQSKNKSQTAESVSTKEMTPEKCEAAPAMLTVNVVKPESIKTEEVLGKQDPTGPPCVTEPGGKGDEKCGKNKKKQKNKESRVKAENQENVILGTKEVFKFAPDISVVTELPIIESSNLHKESLPKISEEQNKVTITEIIEKEVEKIIDDPIVSSDIIDDVEKESDKITDTTGPSEDPTKGRKEKNAKIKQEDLTADIGDKSKESPIEKDSIEMLLPSLAKRQDIDSSEKQISKSPEKHQSDIARDLKYIEDEMKIIMDLTPALSNISLHPPMKSDPLNQEIQIDLICEVPADIVGETSSENVNKEATSDTTRDSSLEMEMWKEVIEKSLREFTELESKNESIGTTSQQPFSLPAVNPDVSSVNTELPKSPIQKIETEMSNLTFKNTDFTEVIIKEQAESPASVIERKKEEKESFKEETKLPETTPILDKDSKLEVKSEALIIDPSSESQNTPQQDQLACSNEQKHKGKGKSKKGEKKYKQDSSPSTAAASQSSTAVTSTEIKDSEKSKTDSEDKKFEESKTVEEKGKSSSENKECEAPGQTCFAIETQDSAKSTEIITIKEGGNDMSSDTNILVSPTSSSESDVQQKEDPMLKSFIIPKSNEDPISHETKPVDPKEIFKPDKENDDGENPICTRPKNLLGHPNIPVTSNRNDYKKEKNKNVEKINPQEAKIKIKDISKTDLPETSQKMVQQETESKQGMTESDNINNNVVDSDNEEDEYVYKYSFRKVFLANTCNICKADLLNNRMTCGYCNLVGYCGQRHKDDDWTQHQALCFAVSTIVHLRGLKFVYADAKSITGQEYRLLRMQTIVSCEKILKRKLTPWEHEILLYPRMCFDSECREFRPALLQDCKDCSQVSFCKDHPAHLTLDHQKWCKSYKLYQKMVLYQQENGRIEPKLPSKIITNVEYQMPADMTTMLKQLYGNEFGVDDCYLAALTQIATAPMTALYGYQLYMKALPQISAEGKMIMNGIHQHSKFTIHIVGAELQFEADTLGKWEVFFLHLYPGVDHLTVTFIGPELNPSNLPLDLLNRIRMCNACKQSKKKVDFEFYDRILYHDFVKTNKYSKPDLICAFNPGLHRTTGFSGLDSWPDTIRSIMALPNTPFCVTSYTKHELPKDLKRVMECVGADYVKVFLEPTLNPYSSTRPDRNFISDDEMPLIFKNFYLMVVSG